MSGMDIGARVAWERRYTAVTMFPPLGSLPPADMARWQNERGLTEADASDWARQLVIDAEHTRDSYDGNWLAAWDDMVDLNAHVTAQLEDAALAELADDEAAWRAAGEPEV